MTTTDVEAFLKIRPRAGRRGTRDSRVVWRSPLHDDNLNGRGLTLRDQTHDISPDATAAALDVFRSS
jgi:hypothetical protein